MPSPGFESREDRREREQLYLFAVKGNLLPRSDADRDSEVLDLVEAYLSFKKPDVSESAALELIKEHGLVREHLPTVLLNSKFIWQFHFKNMSITDMIRNLVKMTAVDALDSERVHMIVDRITNQDELRKTRIHPLTLLNERATYAQGRGDKGRFTWTPISQISEALEKAFYLAMVNVPRGSGKRASVPKTKKRYCLAFDVSGSMCRPVRRSSLTCRQAATAMSLINLRNEEHVKCVAFTQELTELPFTKEWSTDKINQYIDTLACGKTDCGLPMTWATENEHQFDVFIIYTDKVTWAGEIHPSEAIRKYREVSGIHDAKVIVMAMQPAEFSIADPSDAGMLDVAGFDSAVPQILHEFVTGQI